MKQHAWIEAHPYLAAVARFHAEVDAAASALEAPGAPVPDWEAYSPEFLEGVPLLRAAPPIVDLGPVDAMVRRLAEDLAGRDLPASLAGELRTVRAGLGTARIVDRLMEDADPASPGSGLLRYLGWTAAARYLRPAVHAFGRWRDEDRWLRNYCPTCGSAPAMAQLAGVDPERVRLLACGHCATRWRYRRTSCPFCEADTHRLAVIAFEGERRLRIDYCEACKGYLKAYLGEGQEAMFLADWTSLHVDVVALDRGLKRLAGSLYDLPSAPTG